MKLNYIPGADKLINSNPELRDKITKLVFPPKADFSNFDWAETVFLVPGDPTTVVWVKNTIKEISEFLSKQPNSAKPSIVYLGGNNGKYKNAAWYDVLRKLETKFAKAICHINGYELTPFIDGNESEIIHNEVAKEVPDSTFQSVDLETKSTNIHAAMENALTNGYLNNVKNVIIVAGKEYATRCMGTLRATLKAHNLNPQDYNIVAWPYTKTLSVKQLSELQKFMGVDFKIPENGGIVDENNWYKSGLLVYDITIETNSLIKYAEKGHVALSDEQRQLANDISKRLTKKDMMFETAKINAAKLKAKTLDPVMQKIMGDKQRH